MGLRSNAGKREGLLENHLSFAFHEIRGIADAAIARGVTHARDGNRRKMDFSTYYSYRQIIPDCTRPKIRHEGVRRRGRYEKARVASRDLSISRGRRNFLNYNALISLVFLSFPLSPVFLCQTRQLPSCRLSCPGNLLDDALRKQ